MRAAFLFATTLIAHPASAGGPNQCDSLPKPAVTVKRLDNAPSFNTELGYRALTSLGGEKLRPGSQVLGLTRAQATARFSLNLPTYRDAEERYECASPQITLTLGFERMTVYVGKEFPPGSCAYKEILEHEMRHVKTYQAHLAKVEKEVYADIVGRFATGGPWRGQVGASQARIAHELDERWLPYVARELQKVDAAQALIDTPEEYARLGETCGGEVKRRMK